MKLEERLEYATKQKERGNAAVKSKNWEMAEKHYKKVTERAEKLEFFGFFQCVKVVKN